MFVRSRNSTSARHGLVLVSLFLLTSAADALEISGLSVGDPLSKFTNLDGPAKEFLTVTHDPNKLLVRIYYKQEGLPTDLNTQKTILKRLCTKYGDAPSCSSARLALENKTDLNFYQMYLVENEELLRVRAIVSKSVFGEKGLTLELDLMNFNYGETLAKQNGSSFDYTGAYVVANTGKLLPETQEKSVSSPQESDNPKIIVTRSEVDGVNGIVAGRIRGDLEFIEMSINGETVTLDSNGEFSYREYLPAGGKAFKIVVLDRAGIRTRETLFLDRKMSEKASFISFDSLDPTTRQVKANSNAIALIVGVAEYEKTAGAEFADRDAQVFYDYAHLKLGIPQNRIQTLVNDKADEVGLLTGVNKWLKRSVRQGESDVYIFFAGHGLASDDGNTAYLIPYDGAPDFLERTAISRNEVFREVSSVNPRSVTVFLDTCYSGDTRGESRLIAGRPLNIKLQEQSLPKGFTVLTAAGGDQIAKPLKEAQHGMFSYFLMKGMEGGADSNSDNQITARELHTYVRENVVQQSGGSQVPELQGDGEKVLVRFR